MDFEVVGIESFIEALRPDISDGFDPLLATARAHAFDLIDYVTSTGQRVWEWRRGDEPRPQFASARVAQRWMSEWLDRTTA